uniref:Dynactin subunit 6 n=1 Tax=Panagrellus redivivus TaxID=6233 RepID=A0A7E4VSV6_PANRE
MRFAPDAVVIQGAIIEGDVTIGSGTVVHQFATIRAAKGCSIVIGKFNIVEEFVVIENNGPEGSTLEIGNDNTFQARCHISARQIGNNNIFGSFSVIAEGTTVTDMCHICPYGQYRIQFEPMAPRTVIYNGRMDRRTTSEAPLPNQTLCAALSSQLKSFNKLLKPVDPPAAT